MAGFREAVNSATDTAKKHSPDLTTTAKNAFWSTYNHGCNAVNAVKDNGPQMVKSACSTTYSAGWNAANAVKDNGSQMVKSAYSTTYSAGWNAVNTVTDNGSEMVKNYIPGSESVAKISSYVTHPATRELLRYFVPGAIPAFNIAGALLKDKSNGAHSVFTDKKSRHLLEELKAENERLKAELERNRSEYINKTQTPAVVGSLTIASQKPEEVISIFMMKGLNIRDVMVNQVVPIRGKMSLNDQEGYPKSGYGD